MSTVTCYYGNYAGAGRGYGGGMSWYDPYSAVCKSGFYLRNPYTRQPFFCDGHFRGCPWRRWFQCQSMTGSDDGWGVCCLDRGGKYYTIIDWIYQTEKM